MKKKTTTALDEAIIKYYPSGDLSNILKQFDVNLQKIYFRAYSLRVARHRRGEWSEQELRYLTDHYPTDPMSELTAILGKTPGSIYKQAHSLNLKKETYARRGSAYNSTPLGTERRRKQGIFVKTKRGWESKQRVVWRDHHGQIPRGYFVSFADGDPSNYDIDNLRLTKSPRLARENADHR